MAEKSGDNRSRRSLRAAASSLGALATVIGLAGVPAGAHAQTTQCQAPSLWESVEWIFRAFDPSEENPTELPPSALHRTYGVAPRDPSTERRVVLFGDLYPMQGDTPPVVSRAMRDIFARADLIVGNNESRLEVATALDTERDQTASFLATTRFVESMMDQYCMDPTVTVLNVANNHAGDLVDGYEDDARLPWERTLEAIDALHDDGVRATGVGPQSPLPEGNLPMTAVADLGNGVRVGVVGFTQVLNQQGIEDAEGPRCIDGAWTTAEDVFQSAVPWSEFKAQEGIDLLIGSVHWQDQFRRFPTLETRLAGLSLRDLGFDLIAGHGPSVLQPEDSVRDGVFYSLGGLNTNFPVLGTLKLVNVLEVVVDAQGRIVEHTLHAFAQRQNIFAKRLPTYVWCGDHYVYDQYWPSRETRWEVVPLSDLSSSERDELEDERDLVFQ